MGIERGQGATAGATAITGPRQGAGKAGAAATGAGDFLALMAALEDGLGLAQDALAALPGEAGAETEARPLVTLGGDGPDAAATLAAPPQEWMAGALPATPATPAPVEAAAMPSASSAEPVAPAAGQGEASPASGAPAETSGDAMPAELASVFEQLRHRLNSQGAEASASPEQAAAAGQTSHVAARPAGPPRPTSAAAGRADGAQPTGATAAAAAPAAREPEPAPMATSAQAQAAGPQVPVRQEPGAWMPEFKPTVDYDNALGGAEPAQLPPEADPEQPLAESLRYWVHQGLRSAEMTVGTRDPVQVRIALDGNEAQVQLRSEHAATREMLAGAVDQLRDLLSAQGLVLAGLSVGAQGTGSQAQDAWSHRQAQAQAPRQRSGEPDAEAPVLTPRAGRGGGTLDLYV